MEGTEPEVPGKLDVPGSYNFPDFSRVGRSFASTRKFSITVTHVKITRRLHDDYSDDGN